MALQGSVERCCRSSVTTPAPRAARRTREDMVAACGERCEMTPLDVALHEVLQLLVDAALGSGDPIREFPRILLRTRKHLIEERQRYRLRAIR